MLLEVTWRGQDACYTEAVAVQRWYLGPRREGLRPPGKEVWHWHLPGRLFESMLHILLGLIEIGDHCVGLP